MKPVKELRLKISKENQEIAEPFVPEWKTENYILIESKDRWYGIGLALTQSRNRKGLASLFENILRARDMTEVKKRLRDNGVPETALEDIYQENLNPPPKIESDDVEIIPFIDDPPKETSEPDTKTLETRQIKSSSQPSTNASDLMREKGKEAEDWLRDKLKKLLSPKGWKVSDTPIKENGKETDILLEHSEQGKFHIEVKRVEHGPIYWSKHQVQIAKEKQGHYFMAVLRPITDELPYKVTWLWKPLENFQDREIKGSWRWKSIKDEITIINNLNVPKPPPTKEANSFSFIISVDDDFLDRHSNGLKCILEKLGLCL